MYNKLVFKSYGTRNLNKAAARFEQQTGRMAEVFLVRPGWEAFGSKENTEKLLVSRLAGFACVSVPLYLGRDEIKALEVPKVKPKAIKKAEPTQEEKQLKRRMMAYTRYCNYCGRIYGTDPMGVIIHCGSPHCVDKHEQWIEHRKEIKRLQKLNGSKPASSTSRGQNRDKSEIELPEFSLDNPNNPTARGWVYLIEAENGLYKIGRSDNIETRFGELAMMSPVPLWLSHTIFCSNYGRAENWLHQQFQPKRHHGEWFRLSDDEVGWIMDLQDHSLDRA